MPSYVSQGTISVEFDLNEDTNLRADLFFVPNCDYSIKHRGEDCAVFVRSEENQDGFIFKRIEERGVKVTLDVPAVNVPPEGARRVREFVVEIAKNAVDRSSWIAIISGISERRSKVEIQVDSEGGRNLSLTGIRALIG